MRYSLVLLLALTGCTTPQVIVIADIQVRKIDKVTNCEKLAYTVGSGLNPKAATANTKKKVSTVGGNVMVTRERYVGFLPNKQSLHEGAEHFHAVFAYKCPLDT
jgi:hypothetical protein